MKDTILLELANRWDEEANKPEQLIGCVGSEIDNARRKGERETKRACADTIRMLIRLLGDVKHE